MSRHPLDGRAAQVLLGSPTVYRRNASDPKRGKKSQSEVRKLRKEDAVSAVCVKIVEKQKLATNAIKIIRRAHIEHFLYTEGDRRLSRASLHNGQQGCEPVKFGSVFPCALEPQITHRAKPAVFLVSALAR